MKFKFTNTALLFNHLYQVEGTPVAYRMEQAWLKDQFGSEYAKCP